MKTMMKLFGAAILAAAMLSVNSCQTEILVEDTPQTQEEIVVPETVSGIPVTVGAGIVDTKSAVVTDGEGNRTLTFTSGDQLYVTGSLTLNFGSGNEDCELSGYLDVQSIGDPATTATFSGNLELYKVAGHVAASYDFGANNPLDLCTSAQASLVHEGSSFFFDPADGYFAKLADTVDELMTSYLNVSGLYSAGTHSFSLSKVVPDGKVLSIFNCTINGLTANAIYDICLLTGTDAAHATEEIALGGKSANGMGQLTFAGYSFVPAAASYYAFRFKNGNNWMKAVLGSKALQSKVYNITRTAIADPASPVLPTITGTAGTINPNRSITYNSGIVDVTISGTSTNYYFNFNVPEVTLHLDNLSASYHVEPFIVSYSDMFIELTGSNSIITSGNNCIYAYENSIWLSCTGASATLTLTYDSCNRGIAAGNSAIESPGSASVPALAAPGYAVSVTTVDNGNGTYTSTYTVTHTRLLNGQFTINASGDKVRFSQGNLRYLSVDNGHNGSGTWSFAPNQYTVIGNDENNAHPAAPTAGNSMDLFCWGATGIPNLGDLGNPTPNPDGIVDDETPGLYYYTGNNSLSGLYEWGNVTISNTPLTNWRTLTKDEWEYLFSNNAKYGPATVAGSVGIVLLPDSFTDPNKNGGSGAFVSVSQKTGATYNDNVYSAENWEAMEYAGAVFLPAGGIFYEGTFGYSSSDMGHYWTSTPNTNGNTKAYYFAFYHNVCEVRSGDTNSGDSGVYRSSRLSVRLVRTVD